MPADSAHTSRWAIGEVVFGIPLLVSAAAQWAFPATIAQGIPRLILIPLGIGFILGGVGLVGSARRELAKSAQPTDPGQPTSKIVKTGVYGVSRNPMYLGAALVILGLALALNHLWMLGMLALSILLCQFILILPEERYLAAKFGGEYRAYAAAVGRWLGRKT